MILDSLFLITNAYIGSNGKVPNRIFIRRKGYNCVYHISSVVDIACKITGVKRPKTISDVVRIRGLMRKACADMYRYRRKAPYRYLPKSVGKVTGENVGKIIDLRDGHVSVAGIVYDRLLAVINATGTRPSQQAAIMTNATVADVEMFIVDNDKQSYRLQKFLADRGFKALVVTGDKAEGYGNEEGWSAPGVGYQ